VCEERTVKEAHVDLDIRELNGKWTLWGVLGNQKQTRKAKESVIKTGWHGGGSKDALKRSKVERKGGTRVQQESLVRDCGTR
jgi:hypothetical protein